MTGSDLKDQIEDNLQLQRPGYFAPPENQFLYVTIDDINMGKTSNEFNFSSPISLVREHCENQGWYSRQIKTYNRMSSIAFTGIYTYSDAAIQTGKKISWVDTFGSRLRRHFHYIHFD